MANATKVFNYARMTTATTGTGTITLGSAVAPYLTFVQAGVSDGDVVYYSIVDGTSNVECGIGTYTAAGTTLSRTTVLRSSGASNTGKISLSGSAEVHIEFLADGVIGGMAWATEAAVQSDQETATSNVLSVTPGVQQFHPSAAKAWAYCTISGTTLTVAAAYNMSVSRTGIGTYSTSFTTNFSSANYAVLPHGDKSGSICWLNITSQTASALGLSAFNAPSFTSVELTSLTIVCYGDQ
jgi:hypothetical protein